MDAYDKDMDGWLTTVEAALLDKYNIGIWCEVGSWKGKSTCVLASKHRGYAIDWFKGNPETTDIADDTYEEFKKNTDPYRDNIVLLKKRFQDAVKDVSMPIDLLFLDAEHTYEATEEAFNLYSPLVKSGGIVIFHDVWGPDYSTENTAWQEVTDFVTEHIVKKLRWDNIENADRSAAFVKPKGGQ